MGEHNMKKIVLIFCILFVCISISGAGITDKLKSVAARKSVTGGPAQCNIGYESDGGNEMGVDGGYGVSNVWDSATCSGTLSNGYFYSDYSLARWSKVAVYNDDGATAGTLDTTDTLVAISSGVDCAADSWCTLPFSSGSISLSTDYHLVLFVNDSENQISIAYSATTYDMEYLSYNVSTCNGYDTGGDISACGISTPYSSRKLSMYVGLNE